MLSALEAYTAALRELGLPVPYALRDELRTQLCAHRTGRGAAIGTRR